MHAALGFRFLLGFVFLLAGLSKIGRRSDFEQTIRAYELVSRRAAQLIARWLPRLELAGASLLLLGVATIPIAVLLGVLLVGFAGAVGINLARGRKIDCGCFSATAPQKIGWGVVARNLSLAAMAVFASVEAPRTLSLAPLAGRSGSGLSNADALAIGLGATLLVVAWLLATEAFRVGSASNRYVRRFEGG